MWMVEDTMQAPLVKSTHQGRFDHRNGRIAAPWPRPCRNDEWLLWLWLPLVLYSLMGQFCIPCYCLKPCTYPDWSPSSRGRPPPCDIILWSALKSERNKTGWLTDVRRESWECNCHSLERLQSIVVHLIREELCLVSIDVAGYLSEM